MSQLFSTILQMSLLAVYNFHREWLFYQTTKKTFIKTVEK